MIFFYIYFLKIVFNSTKIENKFVKNHRNIIFMDTKINYRIGHIEYIQYKKAWAMNACIKDIQRDQTRVLNG